MQLAALVLLFLPFAPSAADDLAGMSDEFNDSSTPVAVTDAQLLSFLGANAEQPVKPPAVHRRASAH